MDIHKPKPWHGLREFLKEYGIIVLGVLTALALEQGVEALHWRHEVETERSALLSEVRSNLHAVQARMVLQPCMDRRLADLKVVFERHARGQPLRLAGPVGVPPPGEGSRGSWSIAVSGQSLTHVPYKEQLDLSNAFANYENWDAIRRDEREAWVKLGGLDGAEGNDGCRLGAASPSLCSSACGHIPCGRRRPICPANRQRRTET